MGSFLSRLYSVVSTERNRLEEFLTEYLGEVLLRLPSESAESLLKWLSVSGPDKEPVTVQTQHQISVDGRWAKRPDILIFRGDVPVAIIECKVGAGFTWSRWSDDGPDDADGQIHQLEAYGRWLEQDGGRSASLILLTQYSDPPEDFDKDPKYGRGVVRTVRKWSELHRYLKSDETLRKIPMIWDLVVFLEEKNLMTTDIQPNDFAAARLYAGGQSHLRLIQCVNAASKTLRPHLLKTWKGIKFSKSLAQLAYEDEDAYICDWGWTDELDIGWGFWFGGKADMAPWASRFDPVWSLTECVMVYMEFRNKRSCHRPPNGKFEQWVFPAKGNVEDHAIYRTAPFNEFLGTPDSSKRIALWLEAHVKESLLVEKAVRNG